jgi:putative flippase GtrA
MISRARIAELVRYALAGVVSAAITLGVPVALHEGLGIDPRIAVAISLVMAFVVNFITNRRFVFKSQGNARGELQRFAIVSAAFRLGEYGLFLLLFALGMAYYIAQPVVLGLTVMLKFLVYRGFVYGRGVPPEIAP